MSAADERFLELAEKRFDAELVKITNRLQSLADEVARIRTYKADGTRRDPSLVVGEVTGTVLAGVSNLRLELLSGWANDIYEAQRQVKP